MATILDSELIARGLASPGIAECEVIIGRVIEQSTRSDNAAPLTAEQADELTRRST